MPSADSSQLSHIDESTGQCRYVHFAPYTRKELRGFLKRLGDTSGGNLVSALPTLSEPGLYLLAAAVGVGIRDDSLQPDPSLPEALIAELRWRDGKGMGADPLGAARRGRLIQTIATCSTLFAAGASALQRNNLAGRCPFCGGPEFRVFLPTVRWRCFSCDRQGALLEFAEFLLYPRRTDVR